mmetsp:Transcript_16969/g.24595  ORF Transcript_16969/g.24595 Transcript_16969/m.24595 type:complete len:96 (+) Transcript_16969:315-602(+)
MQHTQISQLKPANTVLISSCGDCKLGKEVVAPPVKLTLRGRPAPGRRRPAGSPPNPPAGFGWAAAGSRPREPSPPVYKVVCKVEVMRRSQRYAQR